jgi:TolB-like protein/tetratricopeptide (TPR) repeat protein
MVREERTPLIAVLPFADLSPSRDQAYFAEGISEEILGVLAEEPGLRIIGRTSAARFKSAVDLEALRRVLGVSHVLEGSVRGGAGQVRVNVRLLRSSDGVEVWSERYQRPATDIFALQDEIGASVAAQLGGALGRGKARRRTGVSDVGAYDLYLAGRAHLRRRDRASVTTARALFERAAAIAPAYAPAHAALAEATRLLADDRLGDVPAAEAKAEAERLALRAIRLAPGLADGYAALGFARTYEPGSLEPLERAVRLAPARADARIWLAGGYRLVGRFDDAFRQYEAAYAVEPLWPYAVFNRVDTLSTRRRFDEAEHVVRRYEAVANAPGEAPWLRSIIAEKRGDLSEAVRHGEAAWRRSPDLPDNNARLARAYSMLGLRERASAILPKETEPLHRQITAGQRREAAATAAALGPRFWVDRPIGWRAAEVLAGERRWRDLTRLYDTRFTRPQEFCSYAAGGWAGLGVPFIVALRETGRRSEADVILQCTASGVEAWVRSGDHPPSAWFFSAQVAALQGDTDRALDALDQALAASWQGEHLSPDLSDYPALASLSEEPRFRAARDRLRRDLSRERAEVDALLAPGR